MKVLRVVEREGAPLENDLWLGFIGEQPELKANKNGKWVPIGKDAVQSDWNQNDNTKLDFIKNKPTIPAAQIQSDWSQADDTKADYIKNKPEIPSAQVQADWNTSSNSAKSYIKNKPEVPAMPVWINGTISPNGTYDYQYDFTAHPTYRDDNNEQYVQINDAKKQAILNAVINCTPIVLRIALDKDVNTFIETIWMTQNYIEYSEGEPSKVIMYGNIVNHGNGMTCVHYEIEL